MVENEENNESNTIFMTTLRGNQDVTAVFTRVADASKHAVR
jgi:hypothetical protein